VVYTGVPFIAPAAYHFLLSLQLSRKKDIFVYYAIAAVFMLLSYSNKYFFTGVYSYYWGYYAQAGIIHSIFLVCFVGFFARIIFTVAIGLLKKDSTAKILEIIKLRYILVTILVAIFGSIDFFATYGIIIYPCGYAFILTLIILWGMVIFEII
jgi:hypothetical protein